MLLDAFMQSVRVVLITFADYQLCLCMLWHSDCLMLLIVFRSPCEIYLSKKYLDDFMTLKDVCMIGSLQLTQPRSFL